MIRNKYFVVLSDTAISKFREKSLNHNIFHLDIDVEIITKLLIWKSKKGGNGVWSPISYYWTLKQRGWTES